MTLAKATCLINGIQGLATIRPALLYMSNAQKLGRGNNPLSLSSLCWGRGIHCMKRLLIY